MINLIATDMDGTLLNAAHEISEENIQAIKYAQSLGITVVIATGRAFYEANTPVNQTDLKVPAMISASRESSFALSTATSIPRSVSRSASDSLSATDEVPMSTGRLRA